LKTLLARALALLLLVLPAQGTPLSGTKSVGPTGNYASLTAAIADVQAVGNGLGGALVLELQGTYVSTVEIFPLTIPALNGASATNTLTIRPGSGATALSISSSNTTAATVDLNGAQFVTIDGRPGGAGTAKQLTIANTNTSGVAVRFINEASGNTLRHLTLQGRNDSSVPGTVFFSTTNGANGNDNNTIDTCDIRDGTTTPANAIYSSGSTGTTAQNNSGNTVSNCNIFNFYSTTAGIANGVQIEGGNTEWIIAGNSFYQTASRPASGGVVCAIRVNNASGDNFTITGNFIGGSAPNAGGTAWTTTGTTVVQWFQGIRLKVGTITPSTVQGNTIGNIVWTNSGPTSSPSGNWAGIFMEAGSANIGTITGNTIGSGTGTGSISVTTSANGGTSFGIGSTSTGTLAIANNTIGAITVNGTATGISASLTGIEVAGGANTISNNTVGSTTTANSLDAANPSTSATGQQVTGINVITSSTSANVTGNTVANLNNNYAGATTAQIRGIVTSAGVNTITGNTVRNLSTTSPVGGTGSSSTVIGVAQSSTVAGQTVSQNVVHSLSNTAASAAVSVTGIYYAGSTTAGPNLIARNLVHSLSIVSTHTISQINGIHFNLGTFTAQNNMVRIGLDASGVSTGPVSQMLGIWDGMPTAGRNFYHNSVYVGGTENSGASNTLAFNSSGVSNARAVQNNVFVNVRGNGGGTGKHIAVSYTTITGLTASNNIIFASGNGGVPFTRSGTDYTSVEAWQAATGVDNSSVVVDPLFVNPMENSALVDLHLQPANPAERGGIPIAAVTDDFDGQTRSTLTPVDIGADAGAFTSSSGDIYAPSISHPLLTSGSTVNRVLTDWAAITDDVGVTGGVSAPRFYYKKSTDADLFGVANNSAGNGWKYVIATGSGPYSFTLDYSLLYNGGGGSGSVAAGETIQYFVVAQDAANHLGSSPAGVIASTNPPVQNVYGHGVVNSFLIYPSSGTVTVGTGGTYPTLSGAGGLFAALNGAVLTGHVVANITGNLAETGTFTLNQWQEEGAGNYTLTIQPSSATMRTISGNIGASLITLNGAERVIIDGRFGGSGRWLTFRNSSASGTANTILFINDASSNTVRNCVVEGASGSTLGVIGFSTGTVTGNDNNLITGCQVRDLSTASGVPLYLIGSTGSSAAVSNSGNTVSNNELFNFNFTGIFIPATGNDSWTLSGNNIYEVNAGTSLLVGIQMSGSGTNVITGNSVHDLLTISLQSTGILLGGTGTTTIARNRIIIPAVNAATTTVFGIFAQGGAGSTSSLVNNQITLSPAPAVSTTLYGIRDNGSSGSVVDVFYNSVVLGGTESGTRSSWAILRQGASTHTMRDNVFLNFRSGGTGSHFAAGTEVTGGSYTPSHNVYAGTGATAANFMDFSITASPSAMSYATWQITTGDNSQAGIAGSGNFTTAMFVSAATGDLHLVPGGNVLVNARGTSIAGVTDDYDGDPRNPTTPSIGSDEFPVPDITVAQASVLADGGSVGFGTVTLGGSSAAKTFTITNPGTADLTGLAVSGGTGEFSVSVLSGTTVPVGGGSVTFTVTFTPGASGTRNAALHIASNVIGTKNPFDIMLQGTGQTVYAAWAAGNGVANDPNALGANGQKNVANFAFGMNPAGVALPLVFNGTLAAGGTIGATGLPVTWVEGTDCRALFIVRKNAAAAGLTYTPQFSADLTAAWQTSAATPVVLADDGTNQILSVPYPALMVPGGPGFFHVRVTLAP
jgi:hypothetical protein